MAKKPTIPTLTGGLPNQINQINNSLQALADSFDNTVSRDGSTPNAMEADFDLNSNDILNGKDAYLQNLYLGGSRVVPSDFTSLRYTQSVDNAVERNLSDFLAERVTVTDFGADPTGATNSGVAFQLASDWWRTVMLRRGVIVVPQGEYVVDRPLFTDETLDANLAGFPAGDGAYGLAIVGEFGPGNVTIKPQYTPRGLRTAGLWSGEYAEIPFIEWVQPSKSAFFYMRDIKIQGQEDVTTDPVGFKGVNVNLSSWDNVIFKNLKNTAWSCESLNNSASYHMQISNCGYQPTGYKSNGYLPAGVTFSISSGGTTLTSSTGVFDSGDVGKWLILAPNVGENPLPVKIDTYTSATEVEVVDAAPADYTDVLGSFSIVTGSMTAGDKTLTLDADVALTSLRGALIHVYGAGYEDTSGSGGFNDAEARLLTTRIASVTSSNEVELAHGARVSVSNVPVIFMPSMHIGWSSDTQQYSGNNNDVEFYRLRNESSFANNRGYVAMVTQRVYGIWFIGCKFHGTSPQYDNFGANGLCHVNDNCKHIIFNSCQHEWGFYDPDYGQRVYLGDRIGVRDVYSHFGHPNLVPTKVSWVSVDAVDANDTFVDLSGFNNTSNWVTTADRKYFNFKNSETTQDQVAMSASIFERATGKHYYLIPRDAYSADGVEPIGNATSGTFTPTLELGGTEISTSGGAYTTQTGSWTRHGRLIFINIKLQLSAKGSATGNAAIRIPSDIRATADSARDTATVGPAYITGCSSIDRGVFARFSSNELINLWELVGTGGGGSVAVNDTNLTDTSTIEFNGFYELNGTQYNYYP